MFVRSPGQIRRVQLSIVKIYVQKIFLINCKELPFSQNILELNKSAFVSIEFLHLSILRQTRLFQIGWKRSLKQPLAQGMDQRVVNMVAKTHERY